MSNSDVSKGNVRPGLKAGRSNEFTLIMKIKPRGAERLRKKLASSSEGRIHYNACSVYNARQCTHHTI